MVPPGFSLDYNCYITRSVLVILPQMNFVFLIYSIVPLPVYTLSSSGICKNNK